MISPSTPDIEIHDKKVLRYLYDKNTHFISWLKLIVNADCPHVGGWENVHVAANKITQLEKENKNILDALTKEDD